MLCKVTPLTSKLWQLETEDGHVILRSSNKVEIIDAANAIAHSFGGTVLIYGAGSDVQVAHVHKPASASSPAV